MDGYRLFQLIKCILLISAAILTIGAMLTPYWFTVKAEISWNAGKTQEIKEINLGLYWMDQGSSSMADTVLMEKASNAKTFPGMYRVAQIFFGIGASGLFVMAAVSGIYFLRKYRTATGEICLALMLLPISVCTLLGVVFGFLTAVIEDETAWQAFPIPDSYVKVGGDPPQLAMGYSLYIAAIGAVTALVAFAFAVVNACTMYNHISEIRYRMLNAPLTDDERGVPSGGRTYAFQPAGEFRYDGYGKPGMMEVDF